MKLSIIIPVYNEENTIRELVSKVVKAVLPAGFSREIIIVNDGSTDNTAELISRINNESLRVFHQEKNIGKGAALRIGFEKSKGDIILIQDADLEYNPNDYQKLIVPIYEGRADVVYGSRFIDYPLRLWGKSKTPLPLHWIANKLLTLFTNLLFGSHITDMETCYKVISRIVLQKIKLESNGFEIEAEITAKILKLDVHIFEVPIKVKPRSKMEGKKISWKDGFKALVPLLKYRFSS